MEKGTYLFCLAKTDNLPPLTGLDFAGCSLSCSTFSQVTAVICEVPLDDFCGPASETKMQDIAWIGPRACRHGEIITRIMSHSPVLPIRFGTIFSSLDKLGSLITEHQQQVVDFLNQIADKEEWAVKIMLNKAKARQKIIATALNNQAEALKALSPGLRYFAEQRIKIETEMKLQSQLTVICRQIIAELVPYATDSREREIVGNATENELTAVSNRAYLLPHSVVDNFQDKIGCLNSQCVEIGMGLTCSGPWPPYSFVPRLVNPES